MLNNTTISIQNVVTTLNNALATDSSVAALLVMMCPCSEKLALETTMGTLCIAPGQYVLPVLGVINAFFAECDYCIAPVYEGMTLVEFCMMPKSSEG